MSFGAGAEAGGATPLTAAGRSCIVGFGNPLRRDDGAGPWVVTRLRERLGGRPGLRFLSLHQLEPDVVSDLRGAGLVVMVDATLERPEGGWRCEELAPDLSDAPQVIHHVSPAFVLGLLSALTR